MAVSGTDFNSTLAVTDNVGKGQTIDPVGVNQGDVYDLLSSIVTNFNALNAKLDADGGVTDTNYAATWNLTALAVNNVYANGFKQDALVAAFDEIETNFEGVTAKLDADAGVADTDYASTLDFDNDGDLTAGGLDQDAIVVTLQTIITQFNALLTKLDADTA